MAKITYWKCFRIDDYSSVVVMPDQDQTGAIRHEHARRIVAAVNATLDQSLEVLEEKALKKTTAEDPLPP